MDMEITIVVGGVLQMARRYPDVVREETEAVLGIIVNRLEAEVVRLTPRGVGGEAGLAGSIHGEVTSLAGSSVVGRVGTPLEYGEVAEHGRRPGKFPPRAPIELWVRRKLGVSFDEAGSVSFLVARKIAREGFEGAHMFERAWNNLESWVMAELQTIAPRVARRLEAGT